MGYRHARRPALSTPTRLALVVALAGAALGALAAQESRPATVPPAIRDGVAPRYTPAPLESQRIDGVLGTRMTVNLERRLLEGVDPEPLLKGYRQRPGQQTWIGEHIGKFIDAATNAWASSRDRRLKAKLDRTVHDLLATQLDDGYLGTYVAADRFKDYGGREIEPSEKEPLWDVWAHKYNLIALLNYYQRTGDGPALGASRRIGDLLVQPVRQGTHEYQPQRLARRDGQHQRAGADGAPLPPHR